MTATLINPGISVIIPAYNIEAYLGRAIDSALAQTLPANEIIVVDDGSTDGTARIVQPYGAAVRYIHQPNAGLSAARNTGIRAARFEWIALLDGDDRWLPDMLKKQTELLRQHPDLVWCSGNTILHYTESGREHPMLPEEKIRPFLREGAFFDNYFLAYPRGVWFAPCTMMIRREVFDQVGYFREGLRFAEDLEMWFRIACRWPAMGFVPEPVAMYYKNRPGSLTHDTARRNQIEIICEEIFIPQLAQVGRLGQREAFEAFLVYKTREWMRSLYDQRQFDLIRFLLRKFWALYPRNYRRLMHFLTALPEWTVPWVNAVADAKEACLGPKSRNRGGAAT